MGGTGSVPEPTTGDERDGRAVRTHHGEDDLYDDVAERPLRFWRATVGVMDAMGLDPGLAVDPGSAGRTEPELAQAAVRENDRYETRRLVLECAERIARVFAATCATHFLTVRTDSEAAVRESFAYGLRRLVDPDNGCVAAGRRFGWVWVTWPCRMGVRGYERPYTVEVPSLLLFDGVHREFQDWVPARVRPRAPASARTRAGRQLQRVLSGPDRSGRRPLRGADAAGHPRDPAGADVARAGDGVRPAGAPESPLRRRPARWILALSVGSG